MKWFGAEPKKVKAAYLGVSGSRPTPAMRSQLSLPIGVGLVVEVIDEDSPAAKAGLKQYDVLHKLNDQILINLEQLAILVRTFKPGDEVTLTVLRQSKPITLKAKLIEKEVYDLDNVETLGAAGAAQRPAAEGAGGMNPFLPRFGGGSGVISAYDGEHNLQITLDKEKPRLVVTDKNGKQVFEGRITTEADIKALPESIRKRLESIRALIVTGDGSSSGGMEEPSPKIEQPAPKAAPSAAELH
ncbi:MAG: S1C family serine protease [Thermoguttaceae bacterium]